MKAGEQKAEKDPLGGGAIYVRVANEFPTTPRATPALTNAAITYSSARQARRGGQDLRRAGR